MQVRFARHTDRLEEVAAFYRARLGRRRGRAHTAAARRPRARRRVRHAEMGASAESLWFGVSTVAVPQAVDQFGNAAMVEAIGAGVQLPGGDLAGLGAAVAAALQRGPRARELRDEVRRAGGPERAADAVESLISRS